MPDIVSVQIYSLRSIGGFERQLASVAAAGYKHVELVGSHLDAPDVTRAALAAAGLTASSAHVGIAALRDRIDDVVAACGSLGIVDLYMPAVPREERASPGPYWSALGTELGGMADRCARDGVRLGYHNHDWELRAGDADRTGLDLLFEGAGQSPLSWQIDLAWLERGGADPVKLLQRYQPRITSAHVKDLAPEGENVGEDGWADVGSGRLDWRTLWPACLAAGAKWMVVEHDNPADPARSIARSLAFIRTLPGGAG